MFGGVFDSVFGFCCSVLFRPVTSVTLLVVVALNLTKHLGGSIMACFDLSCANVSDCENMHLNYYSILCTKYYQLIVIKLITLNSRLK